MPRRPILSRETYFVRVEGSAGSSNHLANELLKRLDWNTVTVLDVGPCVEPCQDPGPDATGPVIQIDLSDCGFNAIRVYESEAAFQNDFGTGGRITTYDTNLG